MEIKKSALAKLALVAFALSSTLPLSGYAYEEDPETDETAMVQYPTPSGRQKPGTHGTKSTQARTKSTPPGTNPASTPSTTKQAASSQYNAQLQAASAARQAQPQQQQQLLSDLRAVATKQHQLNTFDPQNKTPQQIQQHSREQLRLSQQMTGLKNQYDQLNAQQQAAKQAQQQVQQ